MKKYDIIIVGMQTSSIFCAYELLKLKTNKKILLVDKGSKLSKREECNPICNITSGFSGSSAFLDNNILSYHLSSFSKDKNEIYIDERYDDYIKKNYSPKEIKECMNYVDDIYLKFGVSNNIIGLDNIKEIKKLQNKSSKNAISLIDIPLRYLEYPQSMEIFKRFEEYLDGKVDLLFETEVTDLIVEENTIKGIKTNKGDILSSKVILTPGVNDYYWLEDMCQKYNINTKNGYIDIGIRYELSNKVMKKINSLMYEGIFIGKTKPYFDKVRTYSQNPSGFVIPEIYESDTSLVNGIVYSEKKSNNTNLAILVSYKFDEPFNSPISYSFNLAKKANIISGGGVIVQRLGDLLTGKSTTKYDLLNNSVVPTMNGAYAGDLSYVLDYRTLNNIINFIKKMNNIIPGFKNDDNLLYGPEIKFSSNELVIDKNFETNIKGLYSFESGSSITQGIMLPSISGVLIARRINNEQ